MKDPKDIYLAARDHAREERAAFLDQACAGDIGLRSRVEQMLAQSADADAYFGEQTELGRQRLAVRPAPTQADPTRISRKAPARRIGPYKLLERLGEGGMGEVWMAEQEKPVRRRVALKLIKVGMDTRSVIARFEAEGQALALMDHPNIARVFDVGATHAGRPYLVMELVPGVKITDYCDQHRLPTRERLGLQIQVCQAIQHAHQKGIIHRDIKPSNILITVNDGVAMPKVIDFGIAKAIDQKLTDKTLFTEFQVLLGTPAYMSPEQADLSSVDIDSRADIYSLGVLLYELLVGRTPFDAAELTREGFDVLRRIIREQDPIKPSTRLKTLPRVEMTTTAQRRQTDEAKLAHQLHGDLDWIAMKCLEKNRARRYETANALAMDLQRYLANEPVLARPPTVLYKARKLWLRNKLAFTGAAVVAIALLAASGVSTWQMNVAKRDRRAAEANAARALAAEQDAIAKAAAERAAREEAEAVTTFLTEVFQSPDPARDGRGITVAETLDRAVKSLETRLADQPARRAQLQITLGATYAALGLAQQAIPLQEQARDFYRSTLGPEHPGSLEAMRSLSYSYAVAGRRAEALAMREHLLALRRKALSLENPDTINAMHDLADSYYDAGRRSEALSLMEEVLQLRRQMLGAEAPATLLAMGDLAYSYAAAGRPHEAFTMREQVLELRRKVLGPEHPDTLGAMHSLAYSYAETGHPEEALALRESLLILRHKINGPTDPNTLRTLGDLASSYFDAGRRDEALILRENVLSLRSAALGPEHPNTLGAIRDLAQSYHHAGRLEEALA